MTFRPMDRIFRISLLLTAVILAPFATVAAGDSIDRAVKRLDPGRLALVPVQNPNPGKIYNHYSDRLNRRVWAFARPDGSFSHALGEGTTQNTKMFDFPYSTDQQREMIAEIAPRWAKSMQQIGSEIFVRLNRKQTWKLVQHLTIPSIYDMETGRRWEWHGNRRVVVGHTGGYRWRVEDGRYLSESDYPYGMVTAPMGCSRCGHAPCGQAGSTY